MQPEDNEPDRLYSERSQSSSRSNAELENVKSTSGKPKNYKQYLADLRKTISASLKLEFIKLFKGIKELQAKQKTSNRYQNHLKPSNFFESIESLISKDLKGPTNDIKFRPYENVKISNV